MRERRRDLMTISGWMRQGLSEEEEEAMRGGIRGKERC